MNGYVDITDYQSTPPSTDPAVLLREERIRSRELRYQLAERDAELGDRERHINELYVQISTDPKGRADGR